MTDAQPSRLLVVELRLLGDAVLALPFVRAARVRHDVFVCCPPASAEIFALAGLPADRIVPWRPPWLETGGAGRPAGWRGAGVGALVRALRAAGARTAASAWADARLHVLMALSGAAVRAGFPMNRRNYLAVERAWRARQLRAGRLLGAAAAVALGRPLLTRRLERESPGQSHLAAWRQLAAALDLPWSDATPWFDAPPPATDEGRRAAALAAAARREGRPVWLVHPGARAATKRWPAPRWQELLDTSPALRRAALLVVRTPDGPELALDGPLRSAVATRDVRELAAVTALADAVLCHDSLPAHLGAALGRRVVAVFGSGDPRWFAPFGSEDLAVRADVCPHHPCMDRCEMPSVVCLEAVTVEAVRQAVERAGAGGGRG